MTFASLEQLLAELTREDEAARRRPEQPSDKASGKKGAPKLFAPLRTD
jgi:hypothetical protein